MRSIRHCTQFTYRYLRIALVLLMAACSFEIVEDNETEWTPQQQSRAGDRYRTNRLNRNPSVPNQGFRSFGGFHSPGHYLTVEAGGLLSTLVPLTVFGFLSVVVPTQHPVWFVRSWGTRGPPSDSL